MNKIYIQAAEQVSIQAPLSEEWMNAPVSYDEPLVKAQNPAFRDYMAANEIISITKLVFHSGG